jgi:hypothetical protein
VPPDYPVLVVVTLNHGSVWGSYATGIHGSPWDDDGHVPLVLYGPDDRAGRPRRVRGRDESRPDARASDRRCQPASRSTAMC